VLAALIEAQRSGEGQVIDAAMVDGVGLLFSLAYELYNRGQWVNARRSNRLDGAAPFYRCYRCRDGKWVAVAAMEMKFRASLARILGLPSLGDPSSNEPERWPALCADMERVFATRDRDEWMALVFGQETCCTPVLDLTEVPGIGPKTAALLHQKFKVSSLEQLKAFVAGGGLDIVDGIGPKTAQRIKEALEV